MNDKIKEIREQSMEFRKGFGCEYRVLNEDAFAELIIKECLDVIIKSYGGHINPKIAIEAVKNHFEVDQKVIGYCGCCGEPHYFGEEIKHDRECICYDDTKNEKITLEIERIIIEEKPRKLKEEWVFEVPEIVNYDISDADLEYLKKIIREEIRDERKD